MKVLLGIIIFFTLFIFTAQAQRNCASVDYTQKLLTADPSLRAAYNTAEAQIKTTTNRALSMAARDTSANEIIYIPVVIHIIYNNAAQNISAEQIASQLTVLNNDYSGLNADKANTPTVFKSFSADTRIRFCLAQVGPDGKRTSGIVRKYTTKDYYPAEDGMKYSAQGGDDAWDCKRYLNIWVCNLGGRTLGYASLPGSPALVDGVVIGYDVFGTVGNVRSPFNKGRTATHEVGHWLGLKHVWGDAICGTDEVDDTPTQQYYNYGCPNFPHVTNCSPNGNGDMFMNFMDLTDDGCMNLFTNGQKMRMRALFAKNNLRNSFLASFACDSTLAQGGTLPVATDTVATDKPVTVTPATKAFATKIYPTAAISTITVECINATAAATKTISIYNVLGTKMYSAKLAADKTVLTIAKLTKGIYIVRIEEGANNTTTKIVKE